MINIYEDGFSQFALAELEKKREREPTSSCFQVMIIDDDWSTIQHLCVGEKMRCKTMCARAIITEYMPSNRVINDSSSYLLTICLPYLPTFHLGEH